MKKKTAILTLFILLALVSACSHKNTDVPNQNPSTENHTTQKNENTNQNQSNNQITDATTGPSRVTDDQSLETAVQDSWIVIITKDLKTNRELVFEGGLKKDDEVVPRLLALYNQDENRVKTASYTLTAPKATFKQDGSRIKGGTFKGDVYVECNNFELVDATVDGNIYFKTQEAKDSFKLDNTSKVTGNVEVK